MKRPAREVDRTREFALPGRVDYIFIERWSMKKKILVVDDDEVFVKVLTHRLEEDFEIETALDGQAFINKAFAWKPDLIILDILLGKEQGPEVYNRIVSRGFSRAVPVLYLSTLVEDPHPPPISPGRRTALLSKYFSSGDLSRNIETLLGEPK